MYSVIFFPSAHHLLLSLLILGTFAASSAGQQAASPASVSSMAVVDRGIAIHANDNRVPAGKLERRVLTLHLVVTSGDWYPEADAGPSMKMDAFAEEGKTPQIPGPLVRVPQGTEIRLSVRNLLPASAVVHGMHSHPGDAEDVLEVSPGEMREVHFVAGEPGTYQYFASAGGELNRGRPFRDDSQLHGAFVVDPPGTIAPDRVFVLGVWRSELSPILSKDVAVINGKSWPYTEQLTYSAGEQARWRLINASDVNHPMHMHGSYYRVNSAGDGERDKTFAPEDQHMVVTQLMPPGSTMTTSWQAVAGRWIFHCHLIAHIAPSRTVTTAQSASAEVIHDHGPNHMAGLVLGITVPGERPKIESHGRARKLQLLVRERPAVNGLTRGFGYQLKESRQLIPAEVTVPGPALVLERGRPVEITVVNQLPEATSVHWHGMELNSYYDGVVGWGIHGRDLTPMIEPGHSFCARFTPPRAGTFIYHTHMDDEVQLSGGLYGALIVLEPGTKLETRSDQIVVISAWGGRRSADPQTPISALMNGSPQPPILHWRVGQRYRLRIINIAPQVVGVVSLGSEKGKLVRWSARAKDGADLPANQVVLEDASQILGPGETYDFDYQPRVPARLTMEFKALAIPTKVTQVIEIE